MNLRELISTINRLQSVTVLGSEYKIIKVNGNEIYNCKEFLELMIIN